MAREYDRCKNSESRLQRNQVTTIMLIDPWWFGERGQIDGSLSHKTGEALQFEVCGITRKETGSPNKPRDRTHRESALPGKTSAGFKGLGTQIIRKKCFSAAQRSWSQVLTVCCVPPPSPSLHLSSYISTFLSLPALPLLFPLSFPLLSCLFPFLPLLALCLIHLILYMLCFKYIGSKHPYSFSLMSYIYL